MYKICPKHDPEPQDFRWIIQPGKRSLAAMSLIIIATLPLMPCLGQTSTPDTAKEDLLQILSKKDATIELADGQYAKGIEAAEKNYEQLLAKAKALRAGKVADARAAAVTDLKAMSAWLAADGKLSKTVKVLKAIYALAPQDTEVAKALVAAGVDLKSITAEGDYFTRRDAKQTSRIVIWNTHNSRFNTSGTLQCNVVLLQALRPVHRFNKVDVPWEPNKDSFAVVNVPAMQFDAVRVEIIKWHGYAGGLAEIEIWQDGKNVAFHRPTRASAAVDRQTTSARVTDGITTSVAYKQGYWLLPDNKAGWIEISLARPAYEKLRRAKVSARTPWLKTVNVVPGDIVDITADGEWWASSQIAAGPDGGHGSGEDKSGKYRNRFYLQGRLDGTVFKIGSQFTLRAVKEGQLELGMNEENVDWFANNSGFLDVVLTVRKRSPLLTSVPTLTTNTTETTKSTYRSVAALR
ncbi:MAG: hypothetical protein HQ515_25105 [Phycisphaeraceae bacterium]|nr:hypothetical protein [Phycisphaeraceae bacterium]